MSRSPSLTDLASRVRGLLAARNGSPRTDPARVIIGIVGEPGAGKSTLAQALTTELAAQGVRAALVPMDGFHLANVTLARRGIADRKGAVETFDGDGYVALLRRLRTFTAPEVVHAPSYDRSIEESVAGAIEVSPDTEIVITEGNYLLVEEEPWQAVPALLDETWFVTVDPTVRRERLIARHLRFGKEPAVAEAWVQDVDQPNADLIRATAARADLVIDLA